MGGSSLKHISPCCYHLDLEADLGVEGRWVNRGGRVLRRNVEGVSCSLGLNETFVTLKSINRTILVRSNKNIITLLLFLSQNLPHGAVALHFRTGSLFINTLLWWKMMMIPF